MNFHAHAMTGKSSRASNRHQREINEAAAHQQQMGMVP